MSKNETKTFTYRMPPDIMQMLEGIQSLVEAKSKTTVMNEAIKFYYGYLTSSISQDYLCGTLGAKLEAVQNRGNDRIARLLFKIAAELNLNTKILSFREKLSVDEYSKIRRKAIQEVTATKGIINLYEAGLEENTEKEGSHEK